MKLYIDDVRITPKGFERTYTYEESINFIVKYGCPDLISFDHDLGEEKSGLDIVKWLVEYDMNNNIIHSDFSFICHSGNPVGKKNIENFLNNYLKFKFGKYNDKQSNRRIEKGFKKI